MALNMLDVLGGVPGEVPLGFLLERRGGLASEDAVVGDGPPLAVGGDGVDKSEPLLSPDLVGRWYAEVGRPGVPFTHGLKGQFSGASFDEGLSLPECLLKVWVDWRVHGREQSDDAYTRGKPPRWYSSKSLVKPFVQDGGDVVGVRQRVGRDDFREGGGEVVSVCFGVSQRGEQGTVGG